MGRIPTDAVEPTEWEAGLSGDMAVRFEKAFGVEMETLMRMQNSCDIAQARQRAKAICVARFSSSQRSVVQAASRSRRVVLAVIFREERLLTGITSFDRERYELP
jgi:hypothetical protein